MDAIPCRQHEIEHRPTDIDRRRQQPPEHRGMARQSDLNMILDRNHRLRISDSEYRNFELHNCNL